MGKDEDGKNVMRLDLKDIGRISFSRDLPVEDVGFSSPSPPFPSLFVYKLIGILPAPTDVHPARRHLHGAGAGDADGDAPQVRPHGAHPRHLPARPRPRHPLPRRPPRHQPLHRRCQGPRPSCHRLLPAAARFQRRAPHQSCPSSPHPPPLGCRRLRAGRSWPTRGRARVSSSASPPKRSATSNPDCLSSTRSSCHQCHMTCTYNYC